MILDVLLPYLWKVDIQVPHVLLTVLETYANDVGLVANREMQPAITRETVHPVAVPRLVPFLDFRFVLTTF